MKSPFKRKRKRHSIKKVLGGFTFFIILFVVVIAGPENSATKIVKRVLPMDWGTPPLKDEKNVAGTLGLKNSLNLLLLANPNVNQYVRDWFQLAADIADGKESNMPFHLTVENILSCVMAEQQTYSGTFIPISFLNVKIAGRSGVEYASETPYGKFTLMDFNALKLGERVSPYYHDPGGDYYVGPFQQTPNLFFAGSTESLKSKTRNWSGSSPSRAQSVYYFPDELNSLDKYFNLSLDIKPEFSKLKLSSGAKAMIQAVAHNGGPDLLYAEMFGVHANSAVKALSLGEKQSRMDGFVNTYTSPQVKDWITKCIMQGVDLTDNLSLNTFMVVALQKQGWKFRNDFPLSVYKRENYPTIYKIINGSLPSGGIQNLILQNYGDSSSQSGERMRTASNYDKPTVFKKLPSGQYQWTSWETARCLFVYGGVGDVTYAKMLKSMNVPVDPSNPATYMNNFNGGETIKIDDRLPKVIALAKSFLGLPYVWGGDSPTGFDCSGFTQYIYKSVGVITGRSTFDQILTGTHVDRANLTVGDLVFFGTSNNPHHVGMYLGNNEYIHSPSTGDVVKISKMNRKDYLEGRRYIQDTSQYVPNSILVKPTGLFINTTEATSTPVFEKNGLAFYHKDQLNAPLGKAMEFGLKDGIPLYWQGVGRFADATSTMYTNDNDSLDRAGCKIFAMTSTFHAIGVGKVDTPGISVKFKEMDMNHNNYVDPTEVCRFMIAKSKIGELSGGSLCTIGNLFKYMGIDNENVTMTKANWNTQKPGITASLLKGYPIIFDATNTPAVKGYEVVDLATNKVKPVPGLFKIAAGGGHYIMMYSYGQYTDVTTGRSIGGVTLIDSGGGYSKGINNLIIDIDTIPDARVGKYDFYVIKKPVATVQPVTVLNPSGLAEEEPSVPQEAVDMDNVLNISKNVSLVPFTSYFGKVTEESYMQMKVINTGMTESYKIVGDEWKVYMVNHKYVIRYKEHEADNFWFELEGFFHTTEDANTFLSANNLKLGQLDISPKVLNLKAEGHSIFIRKFSDLSDDNPLTLKEILY